MSDYDKHVPQMTREAQAKHYKQTVEAAVSGGPSSPYSGLIGDNIAAQPKQKTELGGIKHDQGKPNFALLPIGPTEEIVKVWTFGEKKYAAWNWTLGFKWSRPLAASLRHIFAWARGEDKDPESGLPHLAHAACCLMMLLEFQATGTGEDDRYKRGE